MSKYQKLIEAVIDVVSENDIDKSIKILKTQTNSELRIVGKIEKGKGVDFKNLGLKY